MRVKSPLRLVVAILILFMIIYVGYSGAMSIVTGKPISFGFWSRSGAAVQKNSVENFVVAGVDEEGYRTDLILFCQYDPVANTVSALQVPRDTKVSTKRTDKKINSAYGSPGKEQTMLDELEGIVGFRADKYAIVSFKAFRELIDAIGGVEINVPIRMYYTDPVQNLVIDLRPGQQLLDGKHAEMFMRFRMNNDGSGYKNGDVERNEAQKKFYEAVSDKLLSGSTILKAPKLLGIVSSNLKTNFTGEEIVKYIGKIPKLKMENINIMALPGEGRYENGVSYFFHDKEKTEALVRQYFKQTADAASIPGVNPVKNRFIKVKIIDATSIDSEQADVLKIVSDTLTAHGFKVVSSEKASRIKDTSELINHNAKNAAEEVGKLYGSVKITEEIQEYEKKNGEKSPDVTLIVGNDFVF